jgi:hypothetical protein
MKNVMTLLVICLAIVPLNTAFSETPSALSVPNIQGTYQCWYLNNFGDWNGNVTETIGTDTLYIYQDPYIDANTPNLKIVPKDEPDDFFQGFVQGNTFSFYKDKKHNPDNPNLGREIIVGRIKASTLMGQGVGSDSNQTWGGTWSYSFWAKRISKTVP